MTKKPVLIDTYTSMKTTFTEAFERRKEQHTHPAEPIRPVKPAAVVFAAFNDDPGLNSQCSSTEDGAFEPPQDPQPSEPPSSPFEPSIANDPEALSRMLGETMRQIVAARRRQHGDLWDPSKDKPIRHTSQKVGRIARRGLPGKQAWRTHRRACGTCSETDGWYIAAAIQDVLLIVTWHQEDDNNGRGTGEYEYTYTVVDRSKNYLPTSSLKYATEVFLYACMNELMTKLSKLDLSGDSQRLARYKKFVRGEKNLVKGQDGRSEFDDECDGVRGNFAKSPDATNGYYLEDDEFASIIAPLHTE